MQAFAQRVEDKKQKQKKYVPKVLKAIKKDLGLKLIPEIIEAFDISHHNGKTSLMVYLKIQNLSKKNTENIILNQLPVLMIFCQFMVVHRRYMRLINEKRKLRI